MLGSGEPGVGVLRLIGNVVWLLLGGIWLALLYLLAGRC